MNMAKYGHSGRTTMAMTSQERVMAALQRREPDRVPWCELGVDPYLAKKLMGWSGRENQAYSLEDHPYSLAQMKAIAAFLHLDNIYYVLRAPIYAHKHPGQDGRLFYGEGMLKREADLDLLQLPDPYNDALYAGAEEFVRHKGDFSAWFITRIGISPTMLSMGTESFSLALFDNPALVEKIFDRYCDWVCVVARRICQLGFDVFVSTDDVAYKTNTFFSPQIFRDLVLPRYRRVRESITIPWLIHSDGNMRPFMDDLVSLDIVGFHPNEKGAMDIRATKRDYGDQLCVLGNVDLVTLGMGTPAEVDQEVQELIRTVGPGGGYIISSGNSLAGYLQPENVLAMREAIQTYGRYPIAL
jgi:uroporphyrinogen decarboxylase